MSVFFICFDDGCDDDDDDDGGGGSSDVADVDVDLDEDVGIM